MTKIQDNSTALAEVGEHVPSAETRMHQETFTHEQREALAINVMVLRSTLRRMRKLVDKLPPAAGEAVAS